MGNSEKSLVLQTLNAGAPLPKEVLEAPTLFGGLEIYFEAFFDLDTERHHGNGPMAIPWSSVLRYANFQGFDERQTSELWYHISRMDSWYLKYLGNKMKAEK